MVSITKCDNARRKTSHILRQKYANNVALPISGVRNSKNPVGNIHSQRDFSFSA